MPVLKRHMRSKPEFLLKHMDQNQKARRTEDTFFIDSNQRLRKENAELEAKNEQLEEELSTLNWYIDIYERGHDKLTLLKECKRLQELI